MRSTGVTFRQTLRALVRASTGEYVFFVGRTQSHVDAAMRFARYGVSPLNDVFIYPSKIAFPGGGLLRFMTLDSFDQPGVLEGISEPEIIYDL